MSDLYDVLSGQVPGGFFLFLFILFTVHLLFIYLRRSELISGTKSKKARLVFTLLFLFVYVTLWIILQPPKPQQRIVVLPTLQANGTLSTDASSFEFAEFFQQTSFTDSLKDRYFLHRWEWLLETVGPDSFSNVSFWRHVAKGLGASYIIVSQRAPDGLTVKVIEVGNANHNTSQYQIKKEESYASLLKQIQEDFNFFTQNHFSQLTINRDLLQARVFFYLKEFDRAMRLLKPFNDPEAVVLKAAVYVRKGLRRKIDRQKAQYLKIKIPEFEQARRLLSPLLKKRIEVKGLAYWLGRMAMYEEKFDRAEIFLKKALVDDPEDSRVHFALSFLLPVRLKELGYGTRIEILEKAVKLDPGFRDAVYELANNYFLSGSGTTSGPGTTKAINTVTRFLRIKKNDPQIISLLGMLYIRTGQFDQAQRIFEHLLEQFPKDSNSYYNMGIVYFMKKQYKEALPYFLKAIEMDQNLDAYLYAGITYRQMGNNKMALKYYRERVRRKTGDDDYYATQAMRGIQAVLADSLKRAKQKGNGE